MRNYTREQTGHGARGFTMIEVIVSMAVLAMIGGGIIVFQKSVITNSKVLQSTFISQQQIRKTFATFSAELRSAGPSANGSYSLESISTSSVVFYSNVDNDASVERVRYFFATSTLGSAVLDVLKKGVTKPTGAVYATSTNESVSIVVRDVKNSSTTPIFTFYDSSYSGVASSTAPLVQPVDISAVRLIKMSLSVDPNTGRSPVFQTYETQVSIRNLKDNL